MLLYSTLLYYTLLYYAYILYINMIGDVLSDELRCPVCFSLLATLNQFTPRFKPA